MFNGTPEAQKAVRRLLTGGAAVLGIAVLAAGVWFAGRGMRNQDREAAVLRELEAFPSSELEGRVESVSGDTLVLNVSMIGAVAIPEDSSFRVRSVRMVSTTEIVHRQSKSEEQLARERTEGGFFPLPFRLASIRKEDIRVGDLLRIAEDGYPDLRMKREIVARHIVRESSQ